MTISRDWPEVCLSPDCTNQATLCIVGRFGGIVFYCLDCTHREVTKMIEVKRHQETLEADGCHPRLAARRALEEAYPDPEESS